MTREELQRCELELAFLVPREDAGAPARQDARAFNAEVEDVRAALLEPAERLVEKGSALRELAPCLERTVAQLAFWRRVLLSVHRGAFAPEAARRPEYLVRYLLS